MTKREKVYEKTGGHCAYCGCELKKGWHIDHVKPIYRGDTRDYYKCKGTDDIGNMLPSCPSCNLYKSTMPLETFRRMIANTVNSSKKYTCVSIALRYGLLEETGKKVKFYFEETGKCLKK